MKARGEFGLFFVAIVFTTIVLGVCSGPQRRGIEGTVTLDGQPIPEGYIKLVPLEGTRGPTAGASIVDGRFSIDAAKGTFVGTFRVEILATRETGRQAFDTLAKEAYTVREQYIPAKYNTASELTAEISDSGPNLLGFELVSR
ncbi:MAG: hypothetical protein GX621_09290 [Pirellulaceae bacterium]|nr:hypothetical protein [Pirellulaceae bacterium]